VQFCHDPTRAFTDGKTTSIGIKGGVGQRNAPTILNALCNETQFWDGRAKRSRSRRRCRSSIQSRWVSPACMPPWLGLGLSKNTGRVSSKSSGGAPNGPDLVRAIASYERTQVAFEAPFDHFIAGDNNAIDDSAKRGWALFNTKARCNKCHARSEENRDVTTFTDNAFHNIGIGVIRHNVVALARQAE
jgi:cytochrome c peroxidase